MFILLIVIAVVFAADFSCDEENLSHKNSMFIIVIWRETSLIAD